jgi:hypothetical protein
MASKLGEVLEIESVDSYMKRPAGPMVTIKVRDITKLAGYIKIPSVATLTWPSVGVKPNTWKSWGFGVLRDSRMFRAR